MSEQPQTISAADLVPLAGQVAGHDGVQSFVNKDGLKLVFKPCLPSEITFYQSVKSAANSTASDSPLHRLLDYMPKFEGAQDKAPDVEGRKEMAGILLEDLTGGFEKPNVLDVKLGTQLWDEQANAEKRARMDETSRKTTSGTTGVRLTGWRVWDNTTSEYVATAKAFGKSIKPAQLPLGVRLFFAQPEADDGASVGELLKTDAPATPSLPKATIQRLLGPGVLSSLDDLLKLMQQVEMRMIGGSVLIVYEGDEKLLSAAVESAGSASDTNAHLRGVAKDADRKVLDVRLIDFAHAKLVPGEGPDEGILLGLKTIRNQVAALIGESLI